MALEGALTARRGMSASKSAMRLRRRLPFLSLTASKEQACIDS